MQRKIKKHHNRLSITKVLLASLHEVMVSIKDGKDKCESYPK